MKNILILGATIRPEMFMNTYKEWLKHCKHPERVSLHLIITQINDEELIDYTMFNDANGYIIYDNERKGYNYAISKLTTSLEANDSDILILLSDDFYPPDNVFWDEWVENKFIDWNGAVFLDDGYQNKYSKVGCLCITLACMTYYCLKKLNKIVFHPEYTHCFSDNEAYHNLNELGLLKDDRDTDGVIFQHKHYVSGKRKQDEFDEANFKNFNQDRETYSRRMYLPIEERLTINGQKYFKTIY